MGLFEHDINNLLWKVLFHKSFHLSHAKIRSTIDCETYDVDMYHRQDGWLEYVVQPRLEDPFPHTIYYKDHVVVVSPTFSSLVNNDGFDFGPKSICDQQPLAFSTPCISRWWWSMQDYINCPGGVIAPLILYSDVTFLSNNGKVTRYPFMLSLGNILWIAILRRRAHVVNVLPVILTSNILSH